MLTFFRKIRKALLGSGQTRKYIFYAIGEIALVVIGILIALQINNWNEWRKDRVQEIKILNKLERNLETIEEILRSELLELNDLNNSARIVRSALQNDLPYHDSLGVHFTKSGQTRAFWIKLPQEGYKAYEDAGLDIIVNDNLAEDIVSLFEVTYQDLDNSTELVKENFKRGYDYWDFFNTSYDRGTVPKDYAELKTSKKFETYWNNYNYLRNTIISNELDNSLNATLRVLQLIKEELGETTVE